MEEIDETPAFDENDPFNLFPGLPTAEVEPFGVPIPTPLMGRGGDGQAGTNHDQPSETDSVSGDATTGRDQSSPTTDGSEPTTTGRDEPADSAMGELERAVEAGESYIDRVEQAMDRETCEMCRAILDKLRTRPLEEQVQGVRELAELKHAAQQGADPMELAEVMDDFEVVDDPANMV